MSTDRPAPPAAVDRFWERFIARARSEGIKDEAMRWHVHHAESYLKAISGRRLAEHGAQDVTGYLEALGRRGGIPDWQYVFPSGYDIRTVQELLGHADVSTTMIYTHVLNRGGQAVLSPLDGLE